MRYRGVHYDTGVHFDPERLTRTSLDPEVVEYEMRVIADDLHCTAVRLIGEDLDRLTMTARVAAAAGLTVFFNPWPIDCDKDEVPARFAAAARVAEQLRATGLSDLCFVVGCEVSLFARGLIPGNSVYERVDWLVSLRRSADPASLVPSLADVQRDTRALMNEAAAAVRAEFGGAITYAAGMWEDIDWDAFDIVGLDYYRAEQTPAEYAAGLEPFARYGKPVVVLEFGCCTYVGADRLGGMGWMALDEWDPERPRWKAGSPPERSESTQANYLDEQLGIFAGAGIDGAFVFTFAAEYLPHSTDPEFDFDRNSYAIVATASRSAPEAAAVPPWRPKEAFRAVAERYAALAAP